MFAHHLESAVIGADSIRLDDIARACWRGLEQGAITETDAGASSEAIDARRAAKPVLSQRRAPRSPIGKLPSSAAAAKRRPAPCCLKYPQLSRWASKPRYLSSLGNASSTVGVPCSLT
jgi:hypothetical protein